MSRNMDWRRARRSRWHEPARPETPLPPRDSLERKAAREMRAWGRKLPQRDREKLEALP
jgi:hypothetical protein